MSTRRINGKATKEYAAWKAMKARCYAPSTSHLNYQKNKIVVCDEWRDSFDNFLRDMGKAPSNKHSVDRIRNLEDYKPGNCRWATTTEQTSNRGDFNLTFTYNGKTQVLKAWAKELKIKYTTLYLRIFRSGLSFEEAITNDPFDKLIEYKGRKQSLKDWCTELNLKHSTIIDRKFQGWTVEEMFETPIKKV